MRHLLILLLVGLLTAMSITAAAEIPTLYCGHLSEADCALLNNALTSLPDLKSAQFDLKVEFRQSTDREPLIFMEISGSLRGSLTFEMLRTPELYYVFLQGLEADLNFSTTYLHDFEWPNAHIMLLNGILYADLAGLQSVLQDDSLPDWGCYDLSDDLLKRAEDIKSQNASTSQPLVTGFDLDSLVSSIGEEITEQYAFVTRRDDAANNTAAFDMRVDIAGLYAATAFREALRQQAPNQVWHRNAHFSTITDEQLNRVQNAAARLFPEPALINRYGIDLDTGFFNLVYSWRPDEWLYTIQNALHGGEGSYSTVSGVSFTLELSHFNQVGKVRPPQDARPFPIRRLNALEPIWGMVSALLDDSAGLGNDASC
jgi:hypothetical protein